MADDENIRDVKDTEPEELQVGQEVPTQEAEVAMPAAEPEADAEPEAAEGPEPEIASVQDDAAEVESAPEVEPSVDTEPPQDAAADPDVDSVRTKATVMDKESGQNADADAHDAEPSSASREGKPGSVAADAMRDFAKTIAGAAVRIGDAAASSFATSADAVKKAVVNPDGPVQTTVRTAGKQVGSQISDVTRSRRFSRVGADLFATSAVTSHGGNLSETDGQSIWITRTNSMLGHLELRDIIKTTWDESESDKDCSRELVVHRAIYQALKARAEKAGEEFAGAAIVHAHTTHTIFRSLIEDEILPLESESAYTIGGPVKVYAPATSIASPEAAQILAEAMGDGAKIAVLRGHGPFATADDLEGAERLVYVLEQAAKVADLRDATGRQLQ